MFSATESYWDETDSETTLEMSLFGFQDNNGWKRATDLLDAQMVRDLDGVQVKIDLYRTEVNGDEVLIAHRHPVDDTVNGFDVSDQVFIIAASPTGAPTVVAWYNGPDISFEVDGKNITLLYKRYGVATESGQLQHSSTPLPFCACALWLGRTNHHWTRTARSDGCSARRTS
jgi:hypothetical protein